MSDRNIPDSLRHLLFTHEEKVTIDDGTQGRLVAHVRRSNISFERAGMETLNMPEDSDIVLSALIDRGLYESERDDGLWYCYHDGKLYNLPRPRPARGRLRWRIRHGLRLFVNEVRGLR